MTIDYTSIATAITDQLEVAIPIALVVMGSILAVKVGVGLFKRFCK